MKDLSNKEAAEFLRRYLKEKGGCANCMWTRQVMRDEGFTNGQIRYAVIKLALRVQKGSEPNAWARTFDAWVLPKNKE